MFTGIVEATGIVEGVAALDGDAARIEVHAPWDVSEVALGDSFSVDGVCLTAAAVSAHLDGQGAVIAADVMAETLHRSTLGTLTLHEKVNLELSMQLNGRFGGHVVQGHVDGVGELLQREAAEHWEVLRFSLPKNLNRYVVEKGSIAVDGISLTVTAVDADSFSVSLIPTTLENTTLGKKIVGQYVNLEVDVIAKYVEKLVRT